MVNNFNVAFFAMQNSKTNSLSSNKLNKFETRAWARSRLFRDCGAAGHLHPHVDLSWGMGVGTLAPAQRLWCRGAPAPTCRLAPTCRSDSS